MTFFVARGREKVGPLTLAELQLMASSGGLEPTDMILRQGEPRWQRAETVAGLPFAAPHPPSTPPTPPPPDAEPEPQIVAVETDAGDDGAAASQPPDGASLPPAAGPGWLGAPWAVRLRDRLAGPDSRPWNPLVLLALGVLFGIPWLCVCSAINAARLRGGRRWWRPLLVGGAVMAASALVGAVVGLAGGSWLAFFLLQLPALAGAYFAYWHFDTRHQLAAYHAWREQGCPAGAWWKPALAGLALTVLVMAVDWVMAPVPPERVCARFERALAARDDAAMRKHAHPRLYHAISAVPELEGKQDRDASLELVGDAEWIDGVAVQAFSRRFRLLEERCEVDGTFVLVWWQGRWVVWEVLYWHGDRDAPDALTLSDNYPRWQELKLTGPPPPQEVRVTRSVAPAQEAGDAQAGWLSGPTEAFLNSAAEEAGSRLTRAALGGGNRLPQRQLGGQPRANAAPVKPPKSVQKTFNVKGKWK